MHSFKFSDDQIEIAREWVETNLTAARGNLILARRIGSLDTVSRCENEVEAWQDYGKRLEYEWFGGPQQYVTWTPHLSDLLLAAEGFPDDDGSLVNSLVNYNDQGRPRLGKLEEYTGLGITAREWWTLWPGLAEVEPVEEEPPVEKEPAKEGL